MEELKLEYEKVHGKEGQSIIARGKQKQVLERNGSSSRNSKRAEKQKGESIKSPETILLKKVSLRRHFSHRKAEHDKLDGPVAQPVQELKRRDSQLMSRHATS